MTFKEATDALFDNIDHAGLAKALGVSVATIRQARLKSEAKAHRAPPRNWQRATLKLAEQQIRRYQRLAERLRTDVSRESHTKQVS